MTTIDTKITERIIQLETVKARILEAGQGYPTIFIHGVGSTNGANTWLPCIHEGLADKVHVIAIDQLGWGPVERPVWNYSFPYLVDHIREIQDVLGYEKTNIVGHSLGGWVAATFAYESPDRVNKLVIVANAGLNPLPPPNLTANLHPTREQVAAMFKDVADAGLRERSIEEVWRNVTAPNAAEAFTKINENLNDMDMRRRYFLRRRLSHIKAPTLIVYGSRDTGYPVETFGKEMHASIPGSRFEVLDSAHFIPNERPRELNALIQEFLA